MPKISVIMPFYNCEKFLDASISSILGQTFHDFEFIIINDASTDSSDDIVSKYLIDTRIIYIKNPERRGIVYNLNNAFNYVHSDIIARMDGDDISDITRLKKQYDFLQNNPHISIVGSFLGLIDAKGNLINRIIHKPLSPEQITRDVIRYITIAHACAMIRKNVYDTIGYYRPEYLYCEDTDWTYRALYGGFQGGNLPETLYFYRYHDGSTNQRIREITIKMYKLKRETKKKFKIHFSFMDYLIMYSQFFFGYFFSGRFVQYIESCYKKYFLKNKLH